MVTNVVAFAAVFVGGLAGAWFAAQGISRARRWWQSGGKRRWAKTRGRWQPEIAESARQLKKIFVSAERDWFIRIELDRRRRDAAIGGWEHWPEVTGHVESADWDFCEITDRTADWPLATVAYSYIVDGSATVVLRVSTSRRPTKRWTLLPPYAIRKWQSDTGLISRTYPCCRP